MPVYYIELILSFFYACVYTSVVDFVPLLQRCCSFKAQQLKSYSVVELSSQGMLCPDGNNILPFKESSMLCMYIEGRICPFSIAMCFSIFRVFIAFGNLQSEACSSIWQHRKI